MYGFIKTRGGNQSSGNKKPPKGKGKHSFYFKSFPGYSGRIAIQNIKVSIGNLRCAIH